MARFTAPASAREKWREKRPVAGVRAVATDKRGTAPLRIGCGHDGRTKIRFGEKKKTAWGVGWGEAQTQGESGQE